MNIKKSAIVSVVGRPNVGKSSLVNALVGRKIAIVTNKPQTTRTRITGVANKGECQFVFLDTPGLHKPRSRLGDFMVKVIHETVTEVDIAALVVEPVAKPGPAELELIGKIKEFHMPAVLVINKIDTLPHQELLPVIAAYSELYEFQAVIPVSAKTGDGLPALLEEFEKYAVEGPQLFPDDMVCDQPEKQLIAEIIREKLLKLLDKEVPHGTAVEITQMEEREDGIVELYATIYCEKASHKGIIIGNKGTMLKKCGQMSREDIEKLLGAKVFLELWVKVKEDWRNNMYQMRNFGYDGE